jgi:hypothetical protein
MTKELANAEGIVKPYEILEHEVKLYDAYISGQTYGAMILDSEGELIDSQFGYLGSTKEVIDEAKGMIDHYTH